MPKEVHEIKQFHAGVISTPSESDVPDDAAVYSKNVDPVAEEGKLRPIPNDLFLDVDGGVTISSITYTSPGGQQHNDLSAQTYKGWNNRDRTYTINCTAQHQGGDTFTYSTDGGVTTTTFGGPQAGITNWQTVGEVQVKFGALSDHLINEKWEFNTVSANVDSVKADEMVLMNKDGKHDLVYFDRDDDEFKVVKNLYASAPTHDETLTSSALNNTDDKYCMEKNNEEVHIGLGSAVLDAPQWVGHINTKQFLTTFDGLQVAQAELNTPSPFPHFSQVKTDGDYIYAFRKGDTYLYKFDIGKQKLSIKSGQHWDDIRTICMDDTSNSKFLYLLDKDASTSAHKLYKVDTDTLEISEDYAFDSNFTDLNEVDMINVKTQEDKFWIAGRQADLNSYVYMFSRPVFGTAIVRTNHTPMWEGGGGDPGSAHTAVGSIIKWSGQPSAWNDVSHGSGVSWPHRFCDGAFLYKPTDMAVNSTKSWVGMYGRGHKASNDDLENLDHYYVHTTGCTHAVAGDCVHRHRIYKSSDTYGIPFSYMIRSDFPNASFVGGHDFRTDGSNSTDCVVFNQDHTDYMDKIIVDMNASYSDKGFFGIQNSSTATQGDYYKVTPLTSETDDGTVWTSENRQSSSEIESPRGVFGTSTVAHVFYGGTVGRWAKGPLTSLVGVLESFLTVTAGVHYNSGGSLDAAKYYYYKASFIYDGYQESPLTPLELLRVKPTNAGDDNKIKLILDFKGISALNPRISGINLYVGVGGTNSTEPLGFYRYLKTFALDSSWAAVTDTSADTIFSGTYRQKKWIDDGDWRGASYEANTGISEVLGDTMINYSLSTQLNNYHFVSDAYHPSFGTDNSPNLIFKSKPYNFDQFDVTMDFLRLPTAPNCLASYQGRLYAFDDNNTYRIEPNTFYIEDTFEGVGCIGKDAVIVTEYGMCFADKNNIYMHDGRSPTPIGDRIIRGNAPDDWESKSLKNFTPIIQFDAKRNSFLIFFRNADEDPRCWAYCIPRNRWDLWESGIALNSRTSMCAGKFGEVLGSDGNLWRYPHGDEYRKYSWKSKKLNMGQDTQDKFFKTARIGGVTSNSIDTIVSSKGSVTNAYSSDTDNSKYKLSGTNSKAKWIQYTITDESESIDSIGTIYRRRAIR